MLNAGVGGYGTFQELLYFKEFVINHNPDLVLLQFYSNDVRDNINFQRHWQTLYPDSTLRVSMNSLFEEDILSTERTVIQYAGIGDGLAGSFQSVQAFLRENSHLYHFLHVRLNILRSMLGFRQLAAFDDFWLRW